MAAGVAAGISADFNVARFTLYTSHDGAEFGVKIPYPTSVTFFLGVGLGGEFKVERPTPSINILKVDVDNSGKVEHGGLLSYHSGK